MSSSPSMPLKKRSLEQWWRSHINRFSWWHLLLRPVSWVYAAVTSLRNFLYNYKLLPIRSVGVPVISVGNLVVGGSGKTPFTLMVAKHLARSKRVGIVARGYKGTAEKRRKSIIICRGRGGQYPVSFCGDEPFLIAKKAPHLTVAVGRAKAVAAQTLAQEGMEFILIDDGFQHRRLHRDHDIVLLDGRSTLQANCIFPAGALRESIRGLSRATLVAIHHSGIEFPEELAQEIRRYTAAPVIGIKLVPNVDIDLRGVRVGMFCGIASPASFVQTVQDLGAEIVEQLIVPDHAQPTKEQLITLCKVSKDREAKWLVCTEKDAVKCASDLALPILPIPAEMVVTTGAPLWRDFLNKILVDCPK